MVLMVSFDHIFFKKKLFFQNLFSCKNKKLSIEESERERERERVTRPIIAGWEYNRIKRSLTIESLKNIQICSRVSI